MGFKESQQEAAGERPATPAPTGWEPLVRRMCQADERALEALYDQASRLVYRTALGILRDEADAEEVTLDVFVQAWQQASRYAEGQATVAAWLVVMTKSRAIDRLRRRNARPSEPLDPGVAPADRSPSPEQATIGRSVDARLARCLMALPGDQRRLLELVWREGASHQDLAARFQLPLGTVKTRIRTGMSRLRLQMAH